MPALTTDTALIWRCQDARQIGVLSAPTQPPAHDLGVLVIVGGPQVRTGSHRQFVQLARHLAAHGFPTLRFDVRGMGDSDGEPRNFEALGDDIAAALAAFTAHAPGVRRTVMWGLCDAASAALLYLHERQDPRVAGLVLLNPWARTEQGQAQAQLKHYYWDRLRQKAFWQKLLSGGVAVKAARDLIGNLRQARAPAASPALHYTARMGQAWRAFAGPVLLILSGRDLTAKEFVDHRASAPAWQPPRDAGNTQEHTLADATHTFAEPGMKQQVEALCLDWLQRLAARPH